MSEKPTLTDALSRAGHDLLDSVERTLFGRVGGAEVAARELDDDPVRRIRAEAALADEARQARVDERQAREARARAELDALKAAREAPAPEPKKRTL